MTSIRPEQASDHAQVFQVNVAAFGRAAEARLVEALRRSPAFIPDLSLVAVVGTRVLGHILFSRIVVRDQHAAHAGLALAPLAVLPGSQRRGIGSALVEHGLAQARHLGHTIVIVVGHPGYYPRFGFVPGEPLGLRPPFQVSPGAFLVRELVPGALAGLCGVVEYPREFGLV